MASHPQQILTITPILLAGVESGIVEQTEYTCKHVVVSRSVRTTNTYRLLQDSETITTAKLWATVSKLSRARKKLYVIGFKLLDTLAVSGFFRQIERGRFQVLSDHNRTNPETGEIDTSILPWRGKLYLSQRTTILTVRCNDGIVRLLDTRNWLPITPPDYLKQYDHERYSGKTGGLNLYWDSSDECSTNRAIHDYLTRTIQTHRENGVGGWADTASAIAAKVYRASPIKGKPWPTPLPEVRAAEESAAFGGRFQTWYYGHVYTSRFRKRKDTYYRHSNEYDIKTSGIYHCDISGMYASIMRDMEFPYRYGGKYINPSVQTLADILPYWGVIARVRISTPTDEYPHRDNGKTVYPTGTFWTWLASPELELAIRSGHVFECSMAYRYEMTRPFATVADYCLRMREHASMIGDDYQRALYKCIINAFSGRLGGKAERWTLQPDYEGGPLWGEWRILDADTGQMKHYRSIAGVVSLRSFGERGGLIPMSCYAFLTSYGRAMMRRIREAAGHHTVYSQQTDGIYVSELGLASLKANGLIGDGKPGTLRIDDEINHYNGVQIGVYQVGHKWTISGVDTSAIIRPDGTAHESTIINPISSLQNPESAPLATVKRLTAIEQIAVDAMIDCNGWRIPPMIGAEYNESTVPKIDIDD